MVDTGLIIDFLDYSAYALYAVGIVLVIYGALLSVIGILRAEFARKKLFEEYEGTKRLFIQKIILALDFFVAADLIRLILITDINGVLILALIVAIRTVLSWSLSKEIRGQKEEPK